MLNESNEQVQVGEVGEIVVEGPKSHTWLWGDPLETAKSFRNGKLFTGDLATMDGDGYVYIVDRAKSLLNCCGRRVSTRQLEESMLEFQALQEVAVIGMQDDVLDEAVKAFVVPRVNSLTLKIDHFSIVVNECRKSSCPSRSSFCEPSLKTAQAKCAKKHLRT